MAIHSILLLVQWFCMHYALGDSASEEDISKARMLDLWRVLPKYITEDILNEAASVIPNKTKANEFKHWVHYMNSTFNHTNVSFLQEVESGDMSSGASSPGASSLPQYQQSGSQNPHCDTGIQGPQTVTQVIPGQTTNNPFNQLPSFGFDLTAVTMNMLNKVQSPPGAASTSAGLVGMIGLAMVKNLIQTTVATGLSLVPPMIPPPVWNNMPLPCVPMLTGSNCFGAVMYPITFADSVIADVTDSVLTGVVKSFRSTFMMRAGNQPDAIYQRCFKAYMSMMCSSLFPMCSNMQGRDEMIPGLGRVPICFTSCLMVLFACPGFGFVDIAGPCSEVSYPPMCTQAVYLRDDLQGPQTIESQIEGQLSTKCHYYNPEIDAGQDPLLYEEEKAEKMAQPFHEMQHEITDGLQ